MSDRLHTDDGPAGTDPYPGDGGAQDDPPDWTVSGGVLLRDGEVIAIARDHAAAHFLAAVLRLFAGDRRYTDDDDNPGPGIGGL